GVDDEPQGAVRVGRLRPPCGEREELVAHVHEGHAPGAATELEVEDAPVELERLLDVADLEGDVVQADEARAKHPAIEAALDRDAAGGRARNHRGEEALETLVELDLGLPAEHLLGAGDVG